MGAAKLAVALVLCLLVCSGTAEIFGRRKSSQDIRQQHQVQECRLQKITRSQPSRQIQSEGGSYEIWDTQDDQFQCAGVAAMRVTVNSNSLSLPKYYPTPRLLYVVQGRGLLGLSLPGCPETFHTKKGRQQGTAEGHQKIYRIRRGDVIAIPPGVAHWSYNDADKDLIFLSFNDINSHHNQLDNNFRAFFLAGGQTSQQSQKGGRLEERERPEDFTFRNILSPLDERIVAESLNVPTELVRRMQSSADRGLIVRCDQEMRSLIAPDEELEEQAQQSHREAPVFNGFEEAYCTMQIRYNARTSKKADIYNQDAGKINIVDQHKLPILENLDISIEKGDLLPGAVYAPHWSMTDNRVIYAISGSLNVQIVDDYGNTVMNEKVQEGDIFVIPQFYASVSVAGAEGFEWVTFKSTGLAAKNPMAGYTSVLRAMPIDVLRNAYQFSPSEAQRVKTNRDPEQILFAPTDNSPWRGMIKLPTSN